MPRKDLTLLYAGTAVAVASVLLLLRRRRRLVGLPFRVRWHLWNLEKDDLPLQPTLQWLEGRRAAKVQLHPRLHSLTLLERWYSRLFGWEPDFLAETKRAALEIPTRDGASIRARAVAPRRLSAEAGRWAKTLVLNIHGGGWVFLGQGTHDTVARQLALRTDAVVVNVDYRLAPGHKYPGPLEDCVDALKFVTSETGVKLLETQLACRINAAKVFICGDSAGGNLAAAAMLLVHDSGNRGLMQRMAGQVLVYPCVSRELVSGSGPRGSYERFGDGYGLTRAAMEWFWYQYTSLATDDQSPGTEEKVRYAAIADDHVTTASLTGLPPAIVLLADHDVLADDGMAYAAKLQSAGVKVQTVSVPNTIHGLWDKRALDKSGQGIFVHAAATFINSRISPAHAGERLGLPTRPSFS